MSRREETIADHHARILRVLLYLQEHLDEPVTLEELSGVACFSPYHFHRIFAACVGETLHQHIRRLRLERAARWLLQSEETITAIALRSGYDTPAAFGKAFKKQFSHSPSQFREQRQALFVAFAPPRLQILEAVMQATIKEMPEQRVLFVRRQGNYAEASREAWGVLFSFAQGEGLMAKPPVMLGLSHDDPDITGEERLRYDACIKVDEGVEGEGEVGVQTIAGGRYAVFLHEGAYDTLNETYKGIFAQWLPKSEESLRELPCFEQYLNSMWDTAPKDLRTEIYIPLQ